MKVLLIEDNLVDVEIHQKVIKMYQPSIEIEYRTDGKQGIEYLKANPQLPPDIILLDLFMPEKDGWYFLEEYRKLAFRIFPVLIVLSSSINSKDISRFKQNTKVAAYLSKPFLKSSMHRVMQICKDHGVMTLS